MSELLGYNFFFGLIGGLGLFLLGMKTMSEGMQKFAGEKIRLIIGALTENRIAGTLVGVAVAAIVQSSTVTTVMTVGFVNAGLLSLVQAIGVVLGANIGTTVTAQLIAFNIGRFALPAVAVGVALKLFSRRKKQIYVGEIILGFGLLLIGLGFMKAGFEPLRASSDFMDLLVTVGQYKLLAVLVGALLTLFVQSSSAIIGLTLALATTGLISFETSVALVLGENIGTTITANLAAIGTSLAARRTAFAHFLFNSLGTLLVLSLLPFYLQLVSVITPGQADFVVQTQAQAESLSMAVGSKPYIARHIANAHSLFNIVNVVIFLPFVGILAKLATLAVRGQADVETQQVNFIDSRVLNTPPIAIGQARRETRRMAEIALDMLHETTDFLEDFNLKRLKSLEEKELLVDLLQREITAFLVQLSHRSISAETSEIIGALMHVVNDLERIGDHCEKLWRLGQKKVAAQIVFSDIAENDLTTIGDRTKEFLGSVIEMMDAGEGLSAVRAIEYEDAIDELETRLRQNHIDRLNTGECAVQPGLLFIDMLHSFEKIGDHTFNVSEHLRGSR